MVPGTWARRNFFLWTTATWATSFIFRHRCTTAPLFQLTFLRHRISATAARQHLILEPPRHILGKNSRHLKNCTTEQYFKKLSPITLKKTKCTCLLSYVSCLTSHVSCLLYHVSCIMSTEYWFTSPVSRLLFHVSCLLSHVSFLTFPVSHLLSHVSCLLSPASCLMSHVSCLTYSVLHLLLHVSCLTSPVSHLLSPVSRAQQCAQLYLTVGHSLPLSNLGF